MQNNLVPYVLASIKVSFLSIVHLFVHAHLFLFFLHLFLISFADFILYVRYNFVVPKFIRLVFSVFIFFL